MTDTMRAAWARLRRPLPRAPRTATVTTLAEFQVVRDAQAAADVPNGAARHLVAMAGDPYAALQDVAVRDVVLPDEAPPELQPMTGFGLFLAHKYDDAAATPPMLGPLGAPWTARQHDDGA